MNVLVFIAILAITSAAKANFMNGEFQQCTLNCNNGDSAGPLLTQSSGPSSTHLLRGKSGRTGPKGEPGQKGDQGADGMNGFPGRSGIPGPPGRDGIPGISCDTEELATLRRDVDELKLIVNGQNKGDNGPYPRPPPEEEVSVIKPYQVEDKEVEKLFYASCKEILDTTPLSKRPLNENYYVIQRGSDLFDVQCDMQNGGWIVFQHRFDGSLDFERNFNDYTQGFGNAFGFPQTEFWLGLDKLHKLTRTGKWDLQIDLESFDGETKHAQYSNFSIGAGEDFTLNLGNYNGTAGDSFGYHRGSKFSTPDRDQDNWVRNCARDKSRGGWWYRKCGRTNLNAFQYGYGEEGPSAMFWLRFHNNKASLKSSVMKIREAEEQ